MMDRRRLFMASALLPWALRRSPSQGVDIDFITLTHAGGRQTRYRMMTPGGAAAGATLPVVLFSHGANASSSLYDNMLVAWLAAGVVVLAPDHLDSGGAAPPGSLPPEGLWVSRINDLALPLKARPSVDAVALSRGLRLDWSRICAAGHSFGGAVAQALAGARMINAADGTDAFYGDPAVKAVIAVSPPGPRPGLVPETAWATVDMPALLVTGDADVLPGFIDDWRTHAAGFDQGAAGQRWLVVGDGVDHYFGGLICRLSEGAGAERQRPALAATNAVATAFLRRWKDGDPHSPQALTPEAPAITVTRY